MEESFEDFIKRTETQNRRKFLLGLGGIAASAFLGYLFLKTGSPNSGVDPKFTGFDANGRVIWHPEYALPWFNRGTRIYLNNITMGNASFLMRYPELSRRILSEGIATLEDLVIPKIVSKEDLALVHTPEHIERLYRIAENGEGLSNGENLINTGMLNFVLASVGGTYETALKALEYGSAINLSGGFHHAFRDHEEGFCFFNDIAVAIERLKRDNVIQKPMIVDMDVHHGNGNASIYENDKDVTIFDVYQNHPMLYPKTKIPVDYEVKLAKADDKEYLEKITVLEKALDETNPDLIFYIAGADPYIEDRLAFLDLTKEGLRERDSYVLHKAWERAIPVAVVLGGGYSGAENVAEINANTVKEVLSI